MPKIDAPTVAEHHRLKRAALVGASVDLLISGGTAAVTPAATAAGAGLARSSVYQYFPSTGALLGAAIEALFTRTEASLTEAMGQASTPQDRLMAYVDASLDGAIAGHLPAGVLTDHTIPDDCRKRVVDLHTAIVLPLVEALAAVGVDDAAGFAGLVNGVVNAGAGQVGRGEPVEVVRARVHRFVDRGVAGAVR